MTELAASQELAERAVAWALRRPTALLLRHAHRERIADSTLDAAFAAPLTQQGRDASVALGRRLAGAGTVRLAWSPVPRCEDTAGHLAEGILAGGGQAARVGSRRRLGASFLLDPAAAVTLFGDLGFRGFVERWLEGALDPAVAQPPREAHRDLLDELLEPLAAHAAPALDVHVSHDIVVAALVGAAWDLADSTLAWPGYLEGVALGVEDGVVTMWYRGETRSLSLTDL